MTKSKGTGMANTIRPEPPPKKPKAPILRQPQYTWDWQAAKREFVMSPPPPYGTRTIWLTDMAAKYGVTYQVFHNAIKKWGWDKERDEAAVLYKLGERAGEDKVREELGSLVSPDTPVKALTPALEHKLAVDDAAAEVDRRNLLAAERESLLEDLHSVNTQMRDLVQNDGLTQTYETAKGVIETVNPKVQALKIVTDTLVRRTQIISTLLGDPKKAAPGNVTNNLNLNLPEAKTQISELKEIMERTMQFHAQPLHVFEPGLDDAKADSDAFGGKPLIIEVEGAINDPEVDEHGDTDDS